MNALFGPERIRDHFGIVYEIQRLGYVQSALHGDCLVANYRRPGEEMWRAEGHFRLDCIEFLSPLTEEAA